MTIPRPAALLAFLLVLAACGSGGDEDAAPNVDETPLTAPPSLTAPEGTVIENLDDLEPVEASPDGETGATTASLESILASVGLEATDDIIQCMAERGIGAEVDVSQGLGPAAGAVMGCAPEELAAQLAALIEVEGVDTDKAECVFTEVNRAAGRLSAEEAQTFFDSEVTEIPDQIREVVLGAAPDICDLSEAEVQAVLDA